MESTSYIYVEGKQEKEADWTLKWGETRRKSKRNEKEQRIGLRSGERHGGSPKGKRRSSGLDFEAG